MTNKQVSITMLSSVLLALLALIAARQGELPIEPIPPTVNTEGLCYFEQIAAPAEPEQVMYYTAEDAEAIAKAVWGEARGCTPEGQAKVVWVILNRVGDSRFPDTIQGVVTQPGQFYGYSPTFPVTPEISAVVNDVLSRWNAEKNGIAVTRELDSTYLWFTGDGAQNHFRAVY